MESLVCRLSENFHNCLFEGVEPLLIADREPANSPQRIFLVRYVIVEGGDSESGRAI